MKNDVSRLIIILDGVGDEPNETLLGQTPLQYAKLPNLDYLASAGKTGLADPIAPGITASTAQGTLSLLGYNPQQFRVGRGIVESIGAGAELEPGDVALRGNFATFDELGMIVDRRAGRIREGAEELIESLNGMQIDHNTHVIVKSATEHRFALILRGTNLSAEIKGSDPKDLGSLGKKMIPRALLEGNFKSERTANALAEFEKKAHLLLKEHPVNTTRIQKGLPPANGVLTREPGKFILFPPLSIDHQEIRGICIAAERTVLGVATMAGMENMTLPCMTANLDTNLKEKFRCAKELLEGHDLVVLHIKGTDIAAHDKNPKGKVAFLEKIDEHLGEFLAPFPENSLSIGVIADHGTSCTTGTHICDPVPVLLYGPQHKKDSVSSFNEIEVSQGEMGRFPSYLFLDRLWH